MAAKNVKLETIPKEGGKPWIKSFELTHAEKILRKSKNWKVSDGEKFTFADGALVVKAKKSE